MPYSEALKTLIIEANQPIYICTNSDCKNSIGDPNYEEAIGTNPDEAPKTIKCNSCGSLMEKVSQLSDF